MLIPKAQHFETQFETFQQDSIIPYSQVEDGLTTTGLTIKIYCGIGPLTLHRIISISSNEIVI